MEAKKRSSRVLPVLLLAAAVILIALSTVGTVRAALNEESQDYVGQVETKNIGVALLENGEVKSGDDALLTGLLGEDEDLKLGKTYSETLAATNTAEIDEYIRVEVFKYWEDTATGKRVDLDPAKIELGAEESGWIKGEETDERTVFYYTTPVASGDVTSAFVTSITVDSGLLSDATTVTSANGTTVTTTYEYENVRLVLKAEVKGVQTHNAAAAIKAAWGVDATFSGDTITAIG